MSDPIQKLKSIGAQKIYEDTHIALVYVKSVINENFDGLNRVQFVGFVSILEREYDLDLSALKAKGLIFFDAQEPNDKNSKGVFVVPKRKQKMTYIYIAIVAIIFLIVAIGTNMQETKTVKTEEKLDNKAIETAQKTIQPVVVKKEELKPDLNVTEKPLVKEPETPAPKKEEVKKVTVAKSFKIIPSTKVWVGYIQQDKRIKKQKVTARAFLLDPQKAWLLSFGHGNIKIEIDGKVKKYNSPDSVRFLYENGELKQLSIQEFKKLNKGRLW
jgi:hypothetical protein